MKDLSPAPPRSITWFLGRMLARLAPYRLQASLIVLGLVVDLVFLNAFPLTLRHIIDKAIIPRDMWVLFRSLAFLAAAGLLAILAAVGRDLLYARVGTRMLNDLRLSMFETLQSLSMSFYARAEAGDILARFSTDLAAVENAVVLALPAATLCSLGVLSSASILFFLQWRLGLLTVLGLPICLVGPRLLARRATAAGYELKTRQGVVAGTVHENVSAQAVIKSFGLQPLVLSRFRRELAELYRLGVRASTLNYMLERTPTLGVMLLNVILAGAGAWLVFQGRLSLGSLVSFQGLFLLLSDSVEGLTALVPHFVQATAGMQRIEEVLEERPEIADAAGAGPLPPFTGEIVFERVGFGYAPGRMNLQEISLRIPRGASVALVGPSGSGKSTLLGLLLRFYDPAEGRITVDGHDLRRITQESLRAGMAIVFQETFLLSDTLRENIRLGRPLAADAEVEAAARAAEIHDFILSLPQGYDTPAGERGGRLSGGQRQRMALARALVRDPEILLLDEATAALDPASESAVNATLARIARGRTVISVTHRLSTITGADRIFVLEHGRLAEEGTHRELLERGGTYHALWEKQSGLLLSPDGDRAEVRASWLAAVPILSGLERDLLARLAGRFSTEQVPAGRLVIQEGDPGDRFYLIARGTVEVLKQNAAGEPERVARLEDGDHFGERALLRNAPRNASVRTATPSVFLTLPRGEFLELLGEAPGLRETLEEVDRARGTGEAAGAPVI